MYAPWRRELEIGVFPGFQRRRIRRRSALAARQPCSGRTRSLRTSALAGLNRRDTQCCSGRRRGAGQSTDSPSPTVYQTPAGHPSNRHQSAVGTGKPPGAKSQGVDSCDQRHADDDDILQRKNRAAVKETRLTIQQGQRGKSAGAKDGGASRDRVATFALLARLRQ